MNEQYLFNVRPDRRQLEWQHMEMYAFLHYGMNTMTDREWGWGTRIRLCSILLVSNRISGWKYWLKLA